MVLSGSGQAARAFESKASALELDALRREHASIGVLAVQGSFAAHERALSRMGVGALRRVRRPADLAGLERLVLPGGESTVLSHFLEQDGFAQALCERVRNGSLAVLGTCAGAILLGRAPDRAEKGRAREPRRLGLVPLVVERNAYGRQRDSFRAPIRFAGAQLPGAQASWSAPFEAIFIRAPRFRVPPDPTQEAAALEVLARLADGEPVLVRYGRLLVASFHPELTADDRVHRLFLAL